MAWTTTGDSTGFHLLAAQARTGYSWRTVATLAEPGFETDRWVGNACLTESGKRAVVVYAPRQFANRPALFHRGAFAAIVDLTSGSVRKLKVGVSLAYHNPGCGTGEAAVLNQNAAEELGKTRLHWVDTVSGRITHRVEMAGQLTSAVPAGSEIVFAGSRGLERTGRDGRARLLTRTKGVPFQIHPDRAGGVVFAQQEGPHRAAVRRYSAGRAVELARGPLTETKVSAGISRRVFLSGGLKATRPLPTGVSMVSAPVDAELSVQGTAALMHHAPAPGATTPAAALAVSPGEASPIDLSLKAVSTGRTAKFLVMPEAASDQGRPAVTARQTGLAATGSPTNPVDTDRTCSIARNDARIQVYQPHWNQVEWAANLAVKKALTITRPANWKMSGLPSWSPQGMFPPVDLIGGRTVPPQVMLGILAQESNLWQASGHAVEGVTGNPLVGNFYGLRWGSSDPWAIDWSRSDCGYGVAQVTDGMRLVNGTPTDKQKAVAVDYATNIAAGVRILQQKWNQIHSYLTINDGDGLWLENWFAALWAYNSGVNPQASTGNTSGCTPGPPTCTDDGTATGNWGLGYTNNPANSDYPKTRKPFLDHDHYIDAKNPQWWPYPEKVLGWAAYPIVKTPIGKPDTYEAGYKQAWWPSELDRTEVKPPVELFCSTYAQSNNHCDISRSGQPCMLANYHCWWHWKALWKGDCDTHCGHSTLRYNAGDPEPAGVENYPPDCTTAGLPSGALIIDDVADSVPVVRPNCPRSSPNAGSFGLSFAGDATGKYRSKIDFHQIGAGYLGHFWFAHTRYVDTPADAAMKVTGTWTLGQTINGWARVMVHMPDHGAHTQQAQYEVRLGNGTTKKRVLLQRTEANKWVSLGAFRFAGTPSVSLSNVTQDGTGVEDIAWDAIAFQKLPGKPKHQIVVLGDSYTSGEGASANEKVDYYTDSNNSGGGHLDRRNGCHRSRFAWARQATLADSAGEQIGWRADDWDPSVDFNLLACSGAQTEHLLPSGVSNAFGDVSTGQYHELSQLEKGFLDSNTTLVAFSIGGNDARFGKALELCSVGTLDGSENCKDKTLPGDSEPLEVAESKLIRGDVYESIRTVLAEVHKLAPNAKIVLMGYPRLFDGAESPGRCVPLVTFDEIAWIHSMVDLMNRNMAAATTDAQSKGNPVTFSNPTSAFEGQGACSAAATIHGVIPEKTAGEDPSSPVSSQSMHPSIYGANNYARAFEETLRSIGL